MNAQNNNEDLLIVCKHGDWEEFEDLVKNGADINYVDYWGNNCLHLATQSNLF